VLARIGAPLAGVVADRGYRGHDNRAICGHSG